MNRRVVLLLLVYLPFAAFSVRVISSDGFSGLIGLALREGWGMQMLLDLLIFYGLFCFWLVPDARARGISPWPYVAATALLGSLGAVPYVIHRELRARAQPND